MVILTQAQILLTHGGEFGFNSNILETNLINQVILIIILVVLWKNFNVSGSLLEKQNSKILLVQDSEKRLNDAMMKLTETKKQLSQAQVIIREIQKETKQTKLDLLNLDYTEAKNELDRKFNIAATSLKNRERLIITEIKQNLALLALKKVVAILESKSQTNSSWANQYMQESIKMLGSTL
jgi:F-type H+-transporting ATPase subunit b